MGKRKETRTATFRPRSGEKVTTFISKERKPRVIKVSKSRHKQLIRSLEKAREVKARKRR